MRKIQMKQKIDPNNPNFGALLVVLREQHRLLPEQERKRWMQAIIAAAARHRSTPDEQA